jgi:hypothetical protein
MDQKNVKCDLVLLNNWVHVQSYVTKAEQEKGTGNIQQPPSVLETSRINCAGALADMAGRRYADAAKKFLSVTFDGFQYGVLLSAGDVAKYGGLLSLATLSRKDLKDSLLQSTNFKQFLELEPIMRETILGKVIRCERFDCATPDGVISFSSIIFLVEFFPLSFAMKIAQALKPLL